jgi:cation:H+ antiporter
VHVIRDIVEALGLAGPVTFFALFLAASLLMIWRLEAVMDHGLEGTALGTLVIPYCSGFGNLVFVFLLLRDGQPSSEVVVNSLVNNVTNLTLLLGLPALLWGLAILPAKDAARAGGRRGRGRTNAREETERRLSRLSLLLTVSAALFFTAAVAVLGRDGQLDRNEGLMLIGVFLFWQCFQVFDVLKHNVRQRVSFGLRFYLDLAMLVAGAAVLYESLDWLVAWISSGRGGSWLRPEHLGWLSGWLLVLPNAVLALYYGWRRRADVVYSSQVGDGHICIPLCLGLYAVWRPVTMPAMFESGVILLGAVLSLHLVLLVTPGRLPRWIGGGLVAAYGWFVYAGFGA